MVPLPAPEKPEITVSIPFLVIFFSSCTRIIMLHDFQLSPAATPIIQYDRYPGLTRT